jgi:hypothetical protein
LGYVSRDKPPLPLKKFSIVKNERRVVMKELTEISKIVGTMPVEGLVAAVILAGFALAAYAIYAVLNVSKGHR